MFATQQQPSSTDGDGPFARQTSAVSSSSHGSKKRGRGGVSPVPDVLFQSAVAQVAQVCSKQGYHGLTQLLNGIVGHQGGASAAGSLHHHNAGLPTVSQVQTVATKAHQEQPPWIHWNKSDMAQASLRITSPNRLEIQAQLPSGNNRATAGGYRMARANVGCHRGSYYFELWIRESVPSTNEILSSLPPSMRLAPGLRQALKESLAYEEQQSQAAMAVATSPPRKSSDGSAEMAEPATKRAKVSEEGQNHHEQSSTVEEPPKQVGGRIRAGWSMRTGELQASVGFDKWSFGIRDQGGSIITDSKRIDNWIGSEGFGPGDVLGCAIYLDDGEDHDENNNHIRFFKNGTCMGEFIIAKGKRSGGEAPFPCEIPHGTYYPAVSCYLGGTVRANFGPRFVCPPKKLPAGFKVAPLSDLAPPPETDAQVILDQMSSIFKMLKNGGMKNPEHFQEVLRQGIQAEGKILGNMFQTYHRKNLEEIKQERLDRGLAVQDLETLLEELTKES